jgi:Mrp family chromosome partitioning ATPase
MSVIDRAFIRAYEIDDQPAPSAPATDVAALRSAPAPRRTPIVEAPAENLAPPKPHFRVVSEPAPARAERQTPADRPATTERRPLSAFAVQPRTVDSRFQPSLEVDAFRWSSVCDDLAHNHKTRWQAAVNMLLAADDAGRSLIGVAAAASGAGATTVLACLARLLVDAGKTVAIVDANFANHQLASALGLGADVGWEDVLAGQVPLAEGVVHSLGDRMALLPLARGGAAAADGLESIHASVTAGVLRYHYDMVLFDLGALADPVQGPLALRVVRHCRLDGVVLVARPQDAALVQPELLVQSAPELAAMCLGVVENQPRRS